MTLYVDHTCTVAFDLDDTLYNEIDYLKSAYKHIAGVLDPSNQIYLAGKMFSEYRKGINVFGQLSSNYNISLEALLEIYRNHEPSIAPFYGVIPLFEEIKKNKGKIAIITDGRSITQRNKIVALGLESYIDYIVISEEIQSEKPDERNFKLIENLLPAQNYVYVADNLAKDFIAPNKMGWNSIGVMDNGKNIHNCFQEYYNNKEHCPKHLIDEFAQIKILNQYEIINQLKPNRP